ncbi:patatin-like phospholipase family protein [Vibrio algarum]|uniref:Patatin-like phospholipase family protein n=1 Tax=Vibrio algarum TaxID=3020714 RepID=A0ABT4YVG7_9VIBR|nr:patatin-like phospholipase family protein [Vibrio sp. KJ40-1]MDB1125151.1 patatin-like phospholipase family protein [Vibrio sp. KJ40-1]
MRSISILLFTLVSIAGCSSKGTTSNQSIQPTQKSSYSLSETSRQQHSTTAVLLTFSGGGTRAAALSYGVLKGLNEINYNSLQEESSLLDQVMAISSVSGGSFTAAYYGLYGEQVFERFEQDFLYRDVSRGLLDMLISPKYVFSNQTRTTAAANFYNESLFKDQTFADMREDGPLIIINASDLGGGVRFSFLQEYFDLLCSDILQYSVSDAVTASSAVPIIFEPVALRNFDQCESRSFYSENVQSSPHVKSTLKGLDSYANKKERPYVHLVDGGITDNLGLLAFYDITQSNLSFFNRLSNNIDTVVIIAVDASTQPKTSIDSTIEPPSTASTINAVTDIQLHRYNDMSKHLIIEKLTQWERESAERTTHFIDINLNNSVDVSSMNAIPTDFKLERDQVDALIGHGYQQIMEHSSLRYLE